MLWASPMLTVWAVGCVLTLIVSYILLENGIEAGVNDEETKSRNSGNWWNYCR